MGVVVQFESDYIFCADLLKIRDDTGVLRQKVYIGLKDQNRQNILISPVTAALKVWKTQKISTQFLYAKRVVCFLNYVYFEKRLIKRFEDINIDCVADFINSLTNEGQTRFYVSEYKRILTTFFHYIVCHYDNVCLIYRDSFVVQKNAILAWPELNSRILLPSVSAGSERKRNKISNLDFILVLRFIELAMYEAPNCALGFYFLFFGGLRASEVCHLTDADIPRRVANKAYFSVNISDKIVNEDSKYADITQNKRNRRQIVLYIKELYDTLYADWKKNYKTGPIVQNRFGNGMTARGFTYIFEKVKKNLLQRLSESEDDEDKKLAITLSAYSWSTHIGRGVFSNMIANHSDNPYLIPVARGDKSFDSALPYLAETEKTLKNTSNIISAMYERLKNDADKEKD